MSNEETDAMQSIKDFDQLVVEAQQAFFDTMQLRHEAGQEKYGPIKFMDVNTLNEAMEEVVDLANYAMYTFIKLFVLNQQLQRVVGDQPVVLGSASFIPAGGKG